MGIGCSKGPSEDEILSQISDREMDKRLQAMNAQENRTVKLLLLGTGECGKSTIFKQMQLLYEEGFSQQEITTYGMVLRQNVVESMQVLLSAVAAYQALEANNSAFRYSSEQAAVGATFILQLDSMQSHFWVEGIAPWIKYLWTEPCVQAAYGRRSELQLTDSAAYLFDNIDRIGQEPFVPTKDDILRARLRTTGIVERTFRIYGNDFKFIDVGGQRNERRKWIHCFADVTAIIFIVAISEYDQMLYEDERQNRMRESLQVFNQIVNNDSFKNTTMILFLNKIDLFNEKIKRVALKTTFPTYTGAEGDAAAASTFIKDMFMNVVQNKNKIITIHTTCATDTSNVQKIFETCKQTILANLTDALFKTTN